MKQLPYAFFFAVLLIAGTLKAQVLEQGNFMIGSMIGLSVAQSDVTLEVSSQNEKGERPSSSQFNVALNVDYFVMDNFALGSWARLHYFL